MGPVADEANVVHLRPETAQGIFVNFSNVVTTTRKRPPFGIAQIGKAFRNEITTGNFIYRTREFEMMEIEFFVPPGTDDEWHQSWVNESLKWYTDLGIQEAHLKIREHASEELVHYSKATSDIEYKFPWGWGEIQGTANRTNFDLLAHSGSSGQSLSYFDRTEVGRLMSRVQGDVGQLQEFSALVVMTLGELLSLVGIVVALLFLNVKLGLITMVVIPMLVLIMVVWQRYARKAFIEI